MNFDIYTAVAAFGVGYIACGLPVLVGGWYEKCLAAKAKKYNFVTLHSFPAAGKEEPRRYYG